MIEIRDDQAVVINSISDPEPGSAWLNYSDWNNAWIAIEVIRHALGPEFTPDSISLVSTWPIPAEARELLPRTAIYRGHRSLELTFPRDVLFQKFSSFHDSGQESFRAANPVAASQISQTLSELLRPYLLDGRVNNIKGFSEILETSPRTLQRKLKASGVSFSGLLSPERTRMALKLLRSGDLSLAEISATLGYSEQSSFTRAFSKIMGLSPGAWQRQFSN